MIQVVYFTALFPYFILFALLINNVQLPGAKDGILYFVTPVWDKLFEMKVRQDALKTLFCFSFFHEYTKTVEAEKIIVVM